MFRPNVFLRIVSSELVAKFTAANFNDYTLMLKDYGEIVAPVRQLKVQIRQLKEANAQLEYDISLGKDLPQEKKTAIAAEMARNYEEVQKLGEKIVEAGKALNPVMFEKAISCLEQTMPADVYGTAELIGTEMNEMKVPSSPLFLEKLRKIYFGDSGSTNSELLFRYVERPASMFVLTGDVNDMLKKIPDLFEERGSKALEQRVLDRKKFEELNEVDNERKLLAQLAAQK